MLEFPEAPAPVAVTGSRSGGHGVHGEARGTVLFPCLFPTLKLCLLPEIGGIADCSLPDRPGVPAGDEDARWRRIHHKAVIRCVPESLNKNEPQSSPVRTSLKITALPWTSPARQFNPQPRARELEAERRTAARSHAWPRRDRAAPGRGASAEPRAEAVPVAFRTPRSPAARSLLP